MKLCLWFFSTAVLGPSVALLWRTRQYLADASAVQLTRNPDGLANALQKLNEEPGEIPGGDWASHLFVVSPKRSDHQVSAIPDKGRQQVLAQAWMAASGRDSGQAAMLDFRTTQMQLASTLRAALAGDAQAIGRLRAAYQEVAASDPALAAQVPNPDDFFGARQGDAAAMARLRSAHRLARDTSSGQKNDAESSISSASMLGFHPSMKRRLKRLARMGAHVDLTAQKSKAWIVVLVLSIILAPLFLLLVALFLFLIAIMTMASVVFLVIWLAIIHSVFMLVGHH